MDQHCDYLIIGGGLAGASAVEGIRELDTSRSIVIISAEEVLPYDRPPLSKKLWFGKKEVKDIFLHDRSFYEQKGVRLVLGEAAKILNAKDKTVVVGGGETYRFGKLLLATGGIPQSLDIPGGSNEEVSYYRLLGDYQRIRQQAAKTDSAVIIGGGFIGSEMAAALCANNLQVTMIYPSPYLCNRVFPEALGLAMERLYENRGIRILKKQKPASIERNGSRFVTRIAEGQIVESGIVIVGIGIKPAVGLAEKAGLSIRDGILINQYLQTSHPDIYAAGDNARFPYRATEHFMRLEHWDNAINQGKQAGRNMAGAGEAFTYMPYFFSDLFEFGYEAVGEIDSRMETVVDWQKQNDTGVIYYLQNSTIRGAMMCNLWNKVEEARELIRQNAGATERLG